MNDISGDWDQYKIYSKKKRQDNRVNGSRILAEKGISFEEKNKGAHLIVNGKDCIIDFWPGTGKFITRNGTEGRGIFNLLKLC